MRENHKLITDLDRALLNAQMVAKHITRRALKAELQKQYGQTDLASSLPSTFVVQNICDGTKSIVETALWHAMLTVVGRMQAERRVEVTAEGMRCELSGNGRDLMASSILNIAKHFKLATGPHLTGSTVSNILHGNNTTISAQTHAALAEVFAVFDALDPEQKKRYQVSGNPQSKSLRKKAGLPAAGLGARRYSPAARPGGPSPGN